MTNSTGAKRFRRNDGSNTEDEWLSSKKISEEISGRDIHLGKDSQVWKRWWAGCLNQNTEKGAGDRLRPTLGRAKTVRSHLRIVNSRVTSQTVFQEGHLMLWEGRSGEGRAAGPIRRLLQWSKLRLWLKRCPRDVKVAERNSYLGRVHRSYSHKLLSAEMSGRNVSGGPGTGSECHAFLSLRPHLHPGTSWPLYLGHPGFRSLRILMKSTRELSVAQTYWGSHPDMWLTRPW